MEPKESGRAAQDQLQGASLQDSQLQPDGGGETIETLVPRGSRVIVHLSQSTIQGIVDHDPSSAKSGEADRRGLRIRSLDGVSQRVAMDETEAIFFVRAFGASAQEPVRFHDHAAPPSSLWIRLTLVNGETMEGMVRNGRELLFDPGFLMTPTDPTSNNWLVYVSKTNVTDWQVLGLRHGSASAKHASLAGQAQAAG